MSQKGVPFWYHVGPKRGPNLVPFWAKKGSPFGPLLGQKGIPFGLPFWPKRLPKMGPGIFINSAASMPTHVDFTAFHKQNGLPGDRPDPGRYLFRAHFRSPFGPERGPILVPFWARKGSHSGPLLGQKGVPFWSPFVPKGDPLLGPCGSTSDQPFGALMDALRSHCGIPGGRARASGSSANL